MPTCRIVAEPGSKAKMSKRKLAEYEKQGILVYLHQYIEKGYLPDAVVNYLARLGWSYDASQEIFTRPELIEKFTLEKVNSSRGSPRPGQAVLDRGRVDEDDAARAEGRRRAAVLEERGPGRGTPDGF